MDDALALLKVRHSRCDVWRQDGGDPDLILIDLLDAVDKYIAAAEDDHNPASVVPPRPTEDEYASLPVLDIRDLLRPRRDRLQVTADMVAEETDRG